MQTPGLDRLHIATFFWKRRAGAHNAGGTHCTTNTAELELGIDLQCKDPEASSYPPVSSNMGTPITWSLKMGKSSVNGGYSIAMFDCQYQRVSATYSVDGCSTECSFPTRRSFASVHLHTAVTRPPFTLRDSFSPPLSIYLLAHHMHLNKIIKSTQWCPMLRTAAPTQLAKASCICSGSEVPCLRWCHLNTWRSFRLSFAIGNVQAIHLGIWPTIWSWFIGPTHGHWSLSGLMTPLCPHACDDHIHTHLLDGPGWDIYTKDIVCNKKHVYFYIRMHINNYIYIHMHIHTYMHACIALHCIALHCIALHYITLHTYIYCIYLYIYVNINMYTYTYIYNT